MQFHFITVWFHLKLSTKKDGDYFDRLPERRIWLAYVRQLLSLPFLYGIWSTPTNFTVIYKPMDNLFKKLDNPEISHQFISPQVSRTLKTRKAMNRDSNVTNFYPRFVFSSERPHYSLTLFIYLSNIFPSLLLFDTRFFSGKPKTCNYAALRSFEPF